MIEDTKKHDQEFNTYLHLTDKQNSKAIIANINLSVVVSSWQYAAYATVVLTAHLCVLYTETYRIKSVLFTPGPESPNSL